MGTPSLGQSIRLADLENEPDPILERLRNEEPVCFVEALDMWLVTKWDDVDFIEGNPLLFSASTDPSFLARALGPNMLTTDPPEHTRLHTMLQPPFRASGRSGPFVAGELAALADNILEMIDEPTFDVMTAYAQPLAAGSLATVLGLDHHGLDRMWSWCEGLCADLANFEDDPALTAKGAAAKAELGDAIGEKIAAGDDDDSAIASFVRAGATPEEIVNNVRLMISGGINEPRDGIGLVTMVLLTRPDLRERIEAEPNKLRRLIEETMRIYSPVGTVTRQTTADVEIRGVTIPAGSMVAGVLRSVNVDEDHWTQPFEIDLDRREGTHAAFALGAHRCLGEWLGRQEIRVGVERLFERFPKIRLAVDNVELLGFEFRGPRRLVVAVD